MVNGMCSRNGKNRTLSPGLLPAAAALLLDGGTLHRAKGTEHAAVARLGTQQGLAVAALVVELAGVRGHGLLLGKAAVGTNQDRFKNSAHDMSRFVRWMDSGVRKTHQRRILMRKFMPPASLSPRFALLLIFLC